MIYIPMTPSVMEKGNSELRTLKGHVLIVEDNQINASVLVALIKRLGLTSDVAENGEIAVQAVVGRQYDVIFMDLQMPVMDGFLATESIRKNGYRCPIIAVTANSDYQTRVRCWDIGMNDFISKPVKEAVVLESMARWVRV